MVQGNLFGWTEHTTSAHRWLDCLLRMRYLLLVCMTAIATIKRFNTARLNASNNSDSRR